MEGGALPVVPVPDALKSFINSDVLYVRLVDKVTSKKRRQRRVVALTGNSIVLADPKSGTVKRFLTSDETVALLWQDVPRKQGGTEKHIVIKVEGEHDVALCQVDDKRNPANAHPADTELLQKLPRWFAWNTGRELPVVQMPLEHDIIEESDRVRKPGYELKRDRLLEAIHEAAKRRRAADKSTSQLSVTPSLTASRAPSGSSSTLTAYEPHHHQPAQFLPPHCSPSSFAAPRPALSLLPQNQPQPAPYRPPYPAREVSPPDYIPMVSDYIPPHPEHHFTTHHNQPYSTVPLSLPRQASASPHERGYSTSPHDAGSSQRGRAAPQQQQQQYHHPGSVYTSSPGSPETFIRATSHSQQQTSPGRSSMSPGRGAVQSASPPFSTPPRDPSAPRPPSTHRSPTQSPVATQVHQHQPAQQAQQQQFGFPSTYSPYLPRYPAEEPVVQQYASYGGSPRVHNFKSVSASPPMPTHASRLPPTGTTARSASGGTPRQSESPAAADATPPAEQLHLYADRRSPPVAGGPSRSPSHDAFPALSATPVSITLAGRRRSRSRSATNDSPSPVRGRLAPSFDPAPSDDQCFYCHSPAQRTHATSFTDPHPGLPESYALKISGLEAQVDHLSKALRDVHAHLAFARPVTVSRDGAAVPPSFQRASLGGASPPENVREADGSPAPSSPRRQSPPRSAHSTPSNREPSGSPDSPRLRASPPRSPPRSPPPPAPLLADEPRTPTEPPSGVDDRALIIPAGKYVGPFPPNSPVVVVDGRDGVRRVVITPEPDVREPRLFCIRNGSEQPEQIEGSASPNDARAHERHARLAAQTAEPANEHQIDSFLVKLDRPPPPPAMPEPASPAASAPLHDRIAAAVREAAGGPMGSSGLLSLDDELPPQIRGKPINLNPSTIIGSPAPPPHGAGAGPAAGQLVSRDATLRDSTATRDDSPWENTPRVLPICAREPAGGSREVALRGAADIDDDASDIRVVNECLDELAARRLQIGRMPEAEVRQLQQRQPLQQHQQQQPPTKPQPGESTLDRALKRAKSATITKTGVLHPAPGSQLFSPPHNGRAAPPQPSQQHLQPAAAAARSPPHQPPAAAASPAGDPHEHFRRQQQQQMQLQQQLQLQLQQQQQQQHLLLHRKRDAAAHPTPVAHPRPADDERRPCGLPGPPQLRQGGAARHQLGAKPAGLHPPGGLDGIPVVSTPHAGRPFGAGVWGDDTPRRALNFAGSPPSAQKARSAVFEGQRLLRESLADVGKADRAMHFAEALAVLSVPHLVGVLNEFVPPHLKPNLEVRWRAVIAQYQDRSRAKLLRGDPLSIQTPTHHVVNHPASPLCTRRTSPPRRLQPVLGP